MTSRWTLLPFNSSQSNVYKETRAIVKALPRTHTHTHTCVAISMSSPFKLPRVLEHKQMTSVNSSQSKRNLNYLEEDKVSHFIGNCCGYLRLGISILDGGGA